MSPWVMLESVYELEPGLFDDAPVIFVPGEVSLAAPEDVRELPRVVPPWATAMILLGGIRGFKERSVWVGVQGHETDYSGMLPNHNRDPDVGVVLDHSRWFIRLWTFLARDGKVWRAPFFEANLDHDGRIIPESLYHRDWVKGVPEAALFALALCHCRNVTLTDETDPAPRAVRRRRERTGKPPQIRYRVLQVDEGRPRPRRRVINDGQTAPTALHVCRGHFKTYTDEGPLFGKLTGTYWWSDQLRGDIAAGAVVKDYKIASR